MSQPSHLFESPRRERFFLLALAGIQFTHILDFMIMMPLGPQFIKAFSINAHEFGLLLSAYTFASAGNSGSSHLVSEMFMMRSGVDVVHVPYKGFAPAVSDVIAGQVNLMFDTLLTST